MKRNKVAKLIAVVVLVGAVGVGGSLAFMATESKTVTNTFTAGKNIDETDIVLDEHYVNPQTHEEESIPKDYEADNISNQSKNRVLENTYQSIQALDVLEKDPTVTIKANTADCYIIVKLDGIKDLKEKKITIQLMNYSGYSLYKITEEGEVGTTKVTDASDLDDGYYIIKAGKMNVDGTTEDESYMLASQKEDKEFVLFNELKADTNFAIGDENGNIGAITAKACAVQANNVSVEDAIKKAKELMGASTPQSLQ